LLYQADFLARLSESVFRGKFFYSRIESLEFLDKYQNIGNRLTAIREYFDAESPTPIAAGGRTAAAIGLALYGYARAGIPGIILVGWSLYEVFRYIARYHAHTRNTLIVSALLMAIFAQAGSIHGYGYSSGMGFVIIALFLRRMQSLTSAGARAPKQWEY
jgi:hypothetical protein